MPHKKSEIEAAKIELRKILKPGSQVRVLVTHTAARTNMSWLVRVFCQDKKETREITVLAGRAIDWPLVERHGEWNIRGGGVGTCRYFEVGHHLSYALHGFDAARSPTAHLKGIRRKAEKLEKAMRKACDDCARCQQRMLVDRRRDDVPPHTCDDARRAVRELNASKYRPGYTIKGVAL